MTDVTYHKKGFQSVYLITLNISAFLHSSEILLCVISIEKHLIPLSINSSERCSHLLLLAWQKHFLAEQGWAQLLWNPSLHYCASVTGDWVLVGAYSLLWHQSPLLQCPSPSWLGQVSVRLWFSGLYLSAFSFAVILFYSNMIGCKRCSLYGDLISVTLSAFRSVAPVKSQKEFLG